MSAMPKVTLRQLAVFVSVYQTGSTTKASEALHLSQSAVSSALSDLESLLAMPLFERVGRGLKRHSNADAVYAQAQALLAQAVELENLHKRQAGRVSIGASTTIGNYALPALLGQLYQDLPQAEVQVHIANTKDIVADVEGMVVDMGLVEATPHPEDATVIEQQPWLTDRLEIFARHDSQWLKGFQAVSDLQQQPKHPLKSQPENQLKNKKEAKLLSKASIKTEQPKETGQRNQTYRLTPEQLAGLPLIVREAGSGTRQIIDDKLMTHLPNVKTLLTMNQSEAIKSMVLADIGLGCLSQHVIQEDLASGRLVRIEVAGVELSRKWWLVWHKKRYKSVLWHQLYQQLIQ